MKKIILSLSGLFFLTIGLQAQSLWLYQGDNVIANGSEVTVFNTPDHDPVELSLIVTNNSGNGMDVKVKRTDLSLVTGTNANFCWGTSCYPPFVYESPESVRLDGGASNSSFRGDYTHSGNTGTSRVLYSFFDINNPADSTWLIVNYTIVVVEDHSFEITYNNAVLVNNQEISALYEPAHDPAEISALVKNINTIPVSIKVRKYDLSLLENTTSNICWGPSCYPPFVYDTPEAVLLPSGATDNTFRGDYVHGGVQGSSKVRFTVYNVDNPNDTLSFIVNYTVGYVGIGDVVINTPEISNAYPNPASGNVNFDYKLPASVKNAGIKVTNLLGTVIEEVTLEKTEGKASINVSNLKNGIYFYSLMINNSATTTRKFVIKR
jgi:hypothetical protein